MRPCAGSSRNVKGMSSATAMVGDRPGVAPRINPPTVPISSCPKLNGVKTSPKYSRNSKPALPRRFGRLTNQDTA